jgi:putative CocE/NonD family hydrolase
MTERKSKLANDEMKLLLKLAAKSLIADFQTLSEEACFIPEKPTTIMLPMSDGVRLRLVYRRPEGKGPFPTVIMRSSYPFMEELLEIHAEEYCKRGFAFVFQFCRGVGGSEGIWIPNEHDRQDGKETLEWLAEQDWVENIGYLGSSYLAFTGWVIADLLPEKVKTLYLTHYGTDRFASAYQSGLFRQDVLTAWAMENAGFPVDADYIESARYRPQIEVDERLWGGRLDWYRDWITSTNRDDPYWNSGFWGMLKEIPSKLKIPVYIGEGWYDHHLGSALNTYQDLSEDSKAHSVLRIGAWNHNFMPCVEGTVCENLQNSDVHSAFDWFVSILKEKVTPQRQIHIYQIGADRWEEQPEYPFTPGGETVFYFSMKQAEENAYSLTLKEPTEDAKLQYHYDPDNPVISHGAESLLRSQTEIGSLLQPECGWRPDVISFVTAPLEHDMNILGKIVVKLFVSSNVEDTSFTAKLMEVYPDGKAYNIRSGITTLAYRQGADVQRMSYSPDSIVEVRIDFWDIFWKLHTGSRLRIDISSSDFPQYSIHTNYAGVWSMQEEARVAEQTLYFGPDTLSQVLIPLR